MLIYNFKYTLEHGLLFFKELKYIQNKFGIFSTLKHSSNVQVSNRTLKDIKLEENEIISLFGFPAGHIIPIKVSYNKNIIFIINFGNKE